MLGAKPLAGPIWICRQVDNKKYWRKRNLSTKLFSRENPFKDVVRKLMAHYNDAIMSTLACQITTLAIVHSTAYLGTDERKHQSSASLVFVCGEFTGDR